MPSEFSWKPPKLLRLWEQPAFLSALWINVHHIVREGRMEYFLPPPFFFYCCYHLNPLLPRLASLRGWRADPRRAWINQHLLVASNPASPADIRAGCYHTHTHTLLCMQVTMLPFFCFFVSPSCKSKKHPKLWFKLPFGGIIWICIRCRVILSQSAGLPASVYTRFWAVWPPWTHTLQGSGVPPATCLLFPAVPGWAAHRPRPHRAAL